MTGKKTTPEQRPIAVVDLQPPPAPWDDLAATGCLYLLGDLAHLGPKKIRDYLNDHPLIVVRTGRKKATVVGNFRSWEILQYHSQNHESPLANALVIVRNAPAEDIPRLTAENLFLEGLLGTLSPEYAFSQLSALWKQIPESSQQSLLPRVRTQADFSDALAYRSRSGFDPRSLNRLERAKLDTALSPDKSDDVVDNEPQSEQAAPHNLDQAASTDGTA